MVVSAGVDQVSLDCDVQLCDGAPTGDPQPLLAAKVVGSGVFTDWNVFQLSTGAGLDWELEFQALLLSKTPLLGFVLEVLTGQSLADFAVNDGEGANCEFGKFAPEVEVVLAQLLVGVVCTGGAFAVDEKLG